jgi:DNA-binding NarL/FixJ family response regulator
MAKIHVLLADDHAVLRAGLRMLVNHQPDMEVVAEAGAFGEAIRLAKAHRPDVVVLDLTMPDGNGVDQVEQVCRECQPARVLILTMHEDPAYLRAVLAAGALGYVVKKVADSELLGAIRAVAAGRTFIDLDARGIAPGAALASSNESLPAAPARANPLSEREQIVLEGLAAGHTNQAIADQLDISVKSVESYRARLLRKLGLRTRADIIRYAAATGLPPRATTSEKR